jgi:M6 family metalloprotease-like protein
MARTGKTLQEPARCDRGPSSIVPLFGSALFAAALLIFVSAYPSFAQEATETAGHGPIGIDADYCVTGAAAPVNIEAVDRIHVKILLVEFADVRCAKKADGVTPRYTARDFETLIGSDGTYVSPRMFSPDGEEVFGSVNDYFRAMSGDRLRVSARVINPLGPDGKSPQWIRVADTKAAYQAGSFHAFHFTSEAKRAALGLGLDVSTTDTSRLVIIYAGNVYMKGGGLNPAAGYAGYIMSEQQGKPHTEETPAATFSRIGVHCHEFAHTIGIGHSSGSRADLMESGTRNGSVPGNAPAPLNVITRVRLGWARCVDVGPGDTAVVEVDYSQKAPTVYRMKNSNNDEFYVENRRFDQTMLIGDTETPDYNNALYFPPAWPHGVLTQGILVWRRISLGYQRTPGYADEGLLYASGWYGKTYPEGIPSETDDGVPFPGVKGVKVLSPWSDPRNPYSREPDQFSQSHYTLYVPNTKGGVKAGFEILSEDRARGTFRLKFRVADPPNPVSALMAANPIPGKGQGKFFRESDGRVHMVFGSGGEVFYTNTQSAGEPWGPVRQISSGNGGNELPVLGMAGGTVLVAWQVRAMTDKDYYVHFTRSTDDGVSWSRTASVGQSRNCTGPGPATSLTASRDGSAVLLYRDGLGIACMLSIDRGVTWSPGPRLPVSSAFWGPPSSVMSSDPTGNPRVFAACADGEADERTQIRANTLDVRVRAWLGEVVLSDNLPPRYSGFRNPSVAALQEDATAGGDIQIAWDALDRTTDSARVVVHRVIHNGVPEETYSVLANASLAAPLIASLGGGKAVMMCERNLDKSLWRLTFDGVRWHGEAAPFALGGLRARTSAGSAPTIYLWTRDVGYKSYREDEEIRRELHSAFWRERRMLYLVDPTGPASLTASVGPCRLLYRSGRMSEIPLARLSPDTASPFGLAGAIRTEPFPLPVDAESLQVEFSLSTVNAASLFGGAGAAAFELSAADYGKPIGSFAKTSLRALPENGGIIRLTVALAGLRMPEDSRGCVLSLVFRGFEDTALTGAAGQLLDRGYTRPIEIQIGSVNDVAISTVAEIQGSARPELLQNYPNPFNPRTTFRYELPSPAQVRIEVYNSLGQRVATLADGPQVGGRHEAVFDGTALASGVYVCRMSVTPDNRGNTSVAVRQLILLK